VVNAKVLAESALIGREQELEELNRLLTLALEGKGNTVFVSGEAGSGKTRFTNEFLNSTQHKKGITILSGWCLNNISVPYFPFIQAFKSHFVATEIKNAQNDALEINAWLLGLKQAEQTGKYGNLSPQAWKDLTFEAVSKALLSISADKPTILFIEDLHWADSASLALIHYIARTINSEKILVLATFRGEELTADAEGHQHPFAETLRLMKREDLYTEIKLTSLDQTNVSKIVENMIGGKVQPAFSAKLAEESRGNALFVVESLRMLSERGNLFQENNQWRLSVESLGIPEKFKDIILSRISVLKFSQRRVLDAASVIGEKFDAELLGTVLGQESLEVLETLNIIAQSTSLMRVEGNYFRFDHAKSREAIYEEIPIPLKRGYHARVAEKLESGSKPLPFSDIAYHYAQAGNKEEAVKNAMTAGQDALTRFSNAEAVKHFSYVLETLSDSSGNAETRRAAIEALGDAYYAISMFKEALDMFEQLASIETGKVRLRAYRKAMDTVFFGTRNSTHFMELAAKAEPFAAFDRLESARIRFHKSSYLSRAQSEVEWGAALRVFEEEYSLPDVARTLSAIGFYKTLLYPNEQGLVAMLRSTQMSEELGNLHEVMRSTQWTGVAFLGLGFFVEADGMLNKAIQIGERIGAYKDLAMVRQYLGQVQEQLGYFEEAVSTTLNALKNCEKAGGAGPMDLILANLVRLYSKLGKIDAAEENYWKLMNSPQKDRPVDNNLTREFYIARAQAAFFVTKNQWNEAKQSFDKAFEIAKKIMTVIMLLRKDFVWALTKQGLTEETKVQLDKNKMVAAKIEKKFANLNVQAFLMAPRKVIVGEEFEMRFDLVNVSKKLGLIVKTECLIPAGFKVTVPPTDGSLKNGYFNMKKIPIQPFKVETIKLKLKALNAGLYDLSPQIAFIDESGEGKTCKPNSITITVQSAQPKYEALPGRIPIGSEKLDALLLGGIPQNLAVALTSPSTDEKETIVKRFIETGVTSGETTFCITAEAANTKRLAEKYPTTFYLFVCNPQVDSFVQNQPNVYKLKGIENLTDIDIALTKAFRKLSPSENGVKRICIEIVSDVLLQHHAINTRRWLSALLPTLKSKGFTILAIIDPQMHPPEELQAVLGLFDGEISIQEKETPNGLARFLRIKRLSNQEYSKDETEL
jgi:tetratricopeptide (TPR) repeat protein